MTMNRIELLNKSDHNKTDGDDPSGMSGESNSELSSSQPTSNRVVDELGSATGTSSNCGNTKGKQMKDEIKNRMGGEPTAEQRDFEFLASSADVKYMKELDF